MPAVPAPEHSQFDSPADDGPSIWLEAPVFDQQPAPEAPKPKPEAKSAKVVPFDLPERHGEPRQSDLRQSDIDDVRRQARHDLDLQDELRRVAAFEPFAPEDETVAVQRPQNGPDQAPAAAVEETAPRAVNGLRIPPGLQDSSVLSKLIESPTPFSGVVVAIGINDFDSLRDKLNTAPSNDYITALNKMILSMLRPEDFASRFVDDEYILLYPDESGASAQRRLFQVSEKLWDFQLRSLGHLSVMFSWGGLEVQEETLAEAVASARERMYQTRRNRKSSADVGFGRKRVVNG